MLAYIGYAIRILLRTLGNLRRRLGRPPYYVVFIVEGRYKELGEPRGNFWQRRLFQLEPSLQDLAEQFRTIAGDHRVRGVVMHMGELAMSPAQIQTLRGLIGELRAAGKRVVAWSHAYNNASYHAACAGDEILLQPGGFAYPLGTRMGFIFLADALERVGLKADFVQISPYKSAADVYTRSSMSDELREMVHWVMDSVYDEFIRGIAEGRRLDEDGARALVDAAPYTDLRAIDCGVVDKLIGEEDLPAYLGSPEKPARLSSWEGARRRLLRPPINPPGRHVALLRIEGDIVTGRSRRPRNIPPFLPWPLGTLLRQRSGDLTVVQEARRVLADKRAAAVVVYVDSGGGSAEASEAMAAALGKVAAKKPLVVSMGTVAGSGGYYVATPAHWIVAQPATITGSIGVLSGKFVNAGLLDKLLFHRETISRGQHATFYDAERPFSEDERKMAWEHITRVYDIFVGRVSVARKMTEEAVDAIGGGRVWTGRQALERGLVDELGGLDKALAKARQLAGLHSRAPVREVAVSERQLLPPVGEPAAVLNHALEGLRMYGRAQALCLCPLIWDDAQDDL